MGLGLARKGALLSLFYLTHTKASTPRSILQDDVTWRKQSCKKSCHSALAATSYKKDMQLRDTKEKERNAHTPVFAHDATYTSFMLKLPHHFLRGCTNTHYQENSHTHVLAQQCAAHHWIPSASSASISHHKLTSVFIGSFWHIPYVALKLSKEERFFFP